MGLARSHHECRKNLNELLVNNKKGTTKHDFWKFREKKTARYVMTFEFNLLYCFHHYFLKIGEKYYNDDGT